MRRWSGAFEIALDCMSGNPNIPCGSISASLAQRDAILRNICAVSPAIFLFIFSNSKWIACFMHFDQRHDLNTDQSKAASLLERRGTQIERKRGKSTQTIRRLTKHHKSVTNHKSEIVQGASRWLTHNLEWKL